MTEATAQQMSNKARTDFCSKHDSFADFCFVHHKTEPLIAANKLASYDVIKDVRLFVYASFRCVRLMTYDIMTYVYASVRCVFSDLHMSVLVLDVLDLHISMLVLDVFRQTYMCLC